MLPSWKSCCSCIPQRWIFTILASSGLCLEFVYSVFLSITIIEMVVKTVEPNEQDRGSCPSANNFTPVNQTFVIFPDKYDVSIKLYPWDEYTQGIILSSFSWSYTISHFFYGYLDKHFGGKYIVGLGIFVQAVLTFTTPFLLNWGGSTALIINRVLIGLANGVGTPAISRMIPHWTTTMNRTKIGNAIYSGGTMGMFLANIVPALVIKYSGMGWPAVFYFVGILGMLWFPFWQIFIYEDPKVHPFTTEKEIQFLQGTSEEDEAAMKIPPAPWKQIFLCKEFWAFTIIYSGSNWAFFVMLSGLPRYMGNVVKFSLESNGYFSSLPYIFMWLNSIVSAWISDKILEKQWMTLTSVRKLLTTVSTAGPGIFLLLASYAECDKTMVVIMFFSGITLFGNFISSAIMNPLDLSPNYAGSMMAIGEGIASSIGIAAPYAIGVAPNSTLTEWRIVFWIVFLSAVASNAVYLLWFKAQVQPWDDPNYRRSKTKSCKVRKESEIEIVL